MLTFDCSGERRFKNISDAINVYTVIGELDSHSWATGTGQLQRQNARANSEIMPNSLVVLPFKNMSEDIEQEYFADGFTDDLITEMSRFKEVFVISRNASFGFKEANNNAQEIGEKLGAAYCLEGGIRKLGDRVRINCHLGVTRDPAQIEVRFTSSLRKSKSVIWISRD